MKNLLPKKICVIGYAGFVGHTIFQHLVEAGYSVKGVGSQSPQIDRMCDLVVNCAGNAVKYFANKNYGAARSVEENILDRLRGMKSKRIIHISSIDAEEKNNYGSLKRFVEEGIRKIFPDFCILRLGGLVGEGLSKNVVYDLLHNKPLYTKLDSICNFIHTSAVAELVGYLVEHWQSQEVINVAATESISVEEVAKIMKRNPLFQEDAKTEYYQIDTSKLQTFFRIKDSKYYIIQYLKTIDEKME